MDVATIANFLLFLGAFAASFVSTDDSTDTSDETDDSLYNRADYARTDTLTNGDDSVSADAENLAWFMQDGDDSLSGSSSRDYADLGRGDDTASMGAGNDIVEAGAGNDSVDGGNGNDLTLGGAGNDTALGGLGDDSLGGELGDDWLIGGSGSDLLSGGDGNDVISGFSSLGGATASMTGVDGIDQLFGGAGADRLLMGRGDIAAGGTGADSFEMDARWRDGSGLFTISDFRAGEDSIVLSYAPSIDPNTSLALTPTVTVQATADGLSSLILMNGTVIATVEGVTDLDPATIQLRADTETDTGYRPAQFDDVLDATSGADTATGGEGEDYGRFGTGDDLANAGGGADSLLGEGGNDTLNGDGGNDTLHGGDGNDAIDGGAGNDQLIGGLGGDVLEGGDGTDQVLGGGGNDTLSGFETGDAGGTASTIDGADTLSGGDGDDSLLIGRGDFALGGAGADRFALDATLNDTTAFATIQDYVRGTDQIELHYTRVLDSAGVEVPPTVTVVMGPNNAYAVISFNGDPVAHVTGATTLTLADITLVPEA